MVSTRNVAALAVAALAALSIAAAVDARSITLRYDREHAGSQSVLCTVSQAGQALMLAHLSPGDKYAVNTEDRYTVAATVNHGTQYADSMIPLSFASASGVVSIEKNLAAVASRSPYHLKFTEMPFSNSSEIRFETPKDALGPISFKVYRSASLIAAPFVEPGASVAFSTDKTFTLECQQTGGKRIAAIEFTNPSASFSVVPESASHRIAAD